MKKHMNKSGGGLKKLVNYAKKYMFLIVIVIALCITTVSLTVYGTNFLKTLTNYIDLAAKKVMGDSSISMRSVLDIGYIIRLCLTLAIIYIAAALCNYFQAFIMSSVNQMISKKLRSDIAKKINKLPMSYFDSHSVGDTMSRVTNDIDTIAQSLNNAVSSTISAIVQIILVIIVMFLTSWQMTLTAFATVPISMIITFFIMKASQKYFRNQQSELGTLNGIAEECYTGLSIIRAFNAERSFIEKFQDSNTKLKKAMNRANILSGLTHPVMGFISKLGYIAICVVGGILISNKMTDLGSLAAFLIYINLFQSPLSQIGQITNVFQTAEAASGRVFDFLEEMEQPYENGQIYIDETKVSGKIEFKNVCFGYSLGNMIIKNFSTTIEPGQKVAIVGPTGAGKTTLVNLLMRYYDLQSGEILIDGVSIMQLKRENVRKLFSMVLQETWLFDGTIRENIVYTKDDVDDSAYELVKKMAKIDWYIENLPNRDETIVSDDGLSGGQKQLVTISRAMLKNAPMMILDEATSNVDTRTEQSIQEAMDTMSKGRTSFVIAHRLSTIKNADIILVLKDGNIVEQGKHIELLTQNGFYSELYKSQFAKT